LLGARRAANLSLKRVLDDRPHTNSKSTLWGAGGPGYSSDTDNWATPQDFFNLLDREFHFEVDVCSSEENAKCPRYFTIEDDGLAQEWRGACFMNPPYGRTIGAWIEKAYLSSLEGATVVCLVPARTDTAWWHDWAMQADEIRLVRGRLKFGRGTAPAPFPSAVVVFRPQGRSAPTLCTLNRSSKRHSPY
jgi:phage N-6-adenine-methyltransferase